NLFIGRGISKKIVWMAQVSTNVVDDELLSVMKKAGCVHVEYGFESGSQRILGLMNKSTSVEKNRKAALLTRRHGFRFQGNFIVGYPGETKDDFNKTIEFIKCVKPNNVSMNLFMPLPGTQIYRELKRENKLQMSWDDLGNPEAPQINYADMTGSEFEKLFFKAKLTVVLPLNLMYFLKDNIAHPVRLVYVLSTQFRSVFIRMFKAFAGLLRAGRHGTRALFIAYHSIAEPIMESQGLSYMRGLAQDHNIEFSLLTFETDASIDAGRKTAADAGFPFTWKYSLYHQKPRLLATVWDILRGMFIVAGMIRTRRIALIHCRGLIPALMAYAPARLFRAKVFFDSRGLLADKYVGGGLIRDGSLTYKAMRWCEDFLLRHADFVTVETKSHERVLLASGHVPGLASKLVVIPCCVDLRKFDYAHGAQDTGRPFTVAYLGKVGTWYLVPEMLDFFKTLLRRRPSSRF
ncbi:MAG TPA: radical SAM protein, partial [Candidatus Omnitrophota bacterium]|nr:radical SAM protein [Candidatus Omnitrophota bacterium]